MAQLTPQPIADHRTDLELFDADSAAVIRTVEIVDQRWLNSVSAPMTCYYPTDVRRDYERQFNTLLYTNLKFILIVQPCSASYGGTLIPACCPFQTLSL